MSTDLCMRAKRRLSELVLDIIKDLLTQINGVGIDGKILKDARDPLEDFLRLEIFLEKLKYFDLMVTFRDCCKIDIERIISNSRNEIKSLAQKNPEESIQNIFCKDLFKDRENFKKYLEANFSLCKKILDLSRYQPE